MSPRRLSIFTLSLCLAHLATAQPVVFTDANLKAAVEAELGILNPTAADMLGLTILDANSLDITDLTGLQTAMHLETLYLSSNNIRNLLPLSPLTTLTDLRLSGNHIRDISFLFGLVKLRVLHLEDNQISNHFPLFGLSRLSNLEMLRLSGNQITNIVSVSRLTNLDFLYIKDNPLNFASFHSYIPTLQANGTTVFSDPVPLVMLPDVSTYPPLAVTGTSATLRAGVVSDGGEPSEGRFRYWIQGWRYETERITAWQSVDGVFGKRVNDLVPGTVYRYMAELRNSVGLAPGDERAFTTLSPDPSDPSISFVLYVDDDAPLDPGPTDMSISDPDEDGTRAHPFDSIQEAIDLAGVPHGIIQVRTGRYYETLNLRGKSLHLTGLDTHTGNVTALPVIDANGLGTVITFDQSEDANCVVSGFVLTGGLGELAGAVACLGSSPVLEHCLLVGNRSSDYNGGAVYLEDSHAAFINCTIADNLGSAQGAGVSLRDSSGVFRNCILRNHTPFEILGLGLSAPVVTYSLVAGGWPGAGNLGFDPLFAAPGLWVIADNGELFFIMGDYHLMSQTGRWDPVTGVWLAGNATSPALDAGDPRDAWGPEPAPNGQRINMGAYGGTNQASQSLWTWTEYWPASMTGPE